MISNYLSSRYFINAYFNSSNIIMGVLKGNAVDVSPRN